MEDHDKESLRSNHIALKKAIAPSVLDVLEYLESKKIITTDMKERVEHESRVPGDQASKLLYLIRTRGKYAYQALYDAVRESGLYNAADILRPECAPHELSYEAELQGRNFDLESLSEDEELPDCWPPKLLEREDNFLINVKTLESSSNKDRYEKFYRSSFLPEKENDMYEMSHERRGLCLIINNEDFEHTEMENRVGSEKDVSDTNLLFHKLGFEVVQAKNKKKEGIEELLQSKVVRCDHSRSDCFVLIILSHGDEGVIFGTDGFYDEQRKPQNCVKVSELRKTVCRVPSLVKKPKLFFIQACRGKQGNEGQSAHSAAKEKFDSEVPKDGAPSFSPGTAGQGAEGKGSGGYGPLNSNPGQGKNPVEETQGNLFNLDIDLKKTRAQQGKEDQVDASGETLAILSHSFVAFSTVEGYLSFRNTKQGTWFIQAIVYIFSRFAYKYDLSKLMRKVNQLVSKGEVEKKGYKQICEYHSTLLRDFYFFPKLSTESS